MLGNNPALACISETAPCLLIAVYIYFHVQAAQNPEIKNGKAVHNHRAFFFSDKVLQTLSGNILHSSFIKKKSGQRLDLGGIVREERNQEKRIIMYPIKALIGEHDWEYQCVLFCQCISTMIKWKNKCQTTCKLHKLFAVKITFEHIKRQ